MRFAVVIVAALAFAGFAQAATWVKIGSSSDTAPQASVNVLTLWPVIAAGQKPYRLFGLTMIARPAQPLTVRYRVHCSRGNDDMARSYVLRLRGTPAGTRAVLKTPSRTADYCSIMLDAAGRKYLKAVVWGLRE